MEMTKMKPFQERKKIDIPIRLILSKKGVSYFINNKRKLHKFSLRDNREEYGVELVDFVPKTIQKMLLFGFVKEVQFPVSEIVPYRNRIIDFTKLVTYGMLYMEFGTTIFDMFVQSELVKEWNRKNLKNPIDFKTSVNREAADAFMNNNRSKYRSLKEKIINPLIVEEKRRYNKDDKELQKFAMIADNYLSKMNPIIWFMMIPNYKTEAVKNLIQKIRSKLQRYIEKSAVAEYFAFMLIEVLVGVKKMMEIPAEGKQKENKDESVYVIWKFKKDTNRANDRGKLHVIISNSKSKFEEVRSSIHYRAGQSVKSKSLESFYSSDSHIAGDTHLGLYYLSFLEDACKTLDLKFESFVNFDRRTHQTLINLIVMF